MIRLWLAIAGLGGISSVAFGALATHLADDAKAAELLRIGALYGMVHAAALVAVILNPAVGDCIFGPNRRNSKRWTHFSQRFRLTLRVNNHR